MVNQFLCPFNLFSLVRIIVIGLLISFFLPWIPSTVGPLSGASIVVELVSNITQYLAVGLLPLIFIASWGFIPIGSVVILSLSYTHELRRVPLLSVITGVVGIIPFVISLLMASHFSHSYFPLFLTIACLLALLVVGTSLLWKPLKIDAV